MKQMTFIRWEKSNDYSQLTTMWHPEIHQLVLEKCTMYENPEIFDITLSGEYGN